MHYNCEKVEAYFILKNLLLFVVSNCLQTVSPQKPIKDIPNVNTESVWQGRLADSATLETKTLHPDGIEGK